MCFNVFFVAKFLIFLPREACWGRMCHGLVFSVQQLLLYEYHYLILFQDLFVIDLIFCYELFLFLSGLCSVCCDFMDWCSCIIYCWCAIWSCGQQILVIVHSLAVFIICVYATVALACHFVVYTVKLEQVPRITWNATWLETCSVWILYLICLCLYMFALLLYDSIH